MKKLVLFLLLILGWSLANGQRQPILPYGKHPIEEVEKFAKGNSPKAIQFRESILSKTEESNIESLFNKVSIKDTVLEAGSYMNSCWNVATQKIEPYSGKRFEGKVAIYNGGLYEEILYKDTCINVLGGKRIFLGLIEEDQPKLSLEQDNIPKQSVVIVENYYYNGGLNPIWNLTPRKKINWEPVIIIGGVAVGLVGVACGIYSLLNYINGVPGGAPTTPPGDEGGPGGSPTTK